jgi:hypothetical protein
MGSTLAKDGKPVWAPSAGSVLRAIATFGRSVKDLQLPDGIGDDSPDDGVQPGTLMPDLHVLPGIWTPLKGYTTVIDRLASRGFRLVSADLQTPPGNLLPVPYDWRLSNRYNGNRLATIVEPALERWRAQGGAFADAKVCFVCHSMGGLVARWYITHGGAEITRKLVTLGTPYRGAARALDQLFHGVHHGIGPLSLDLTDFARSLPSLHQLLPSYACIERDNELATLDEFGTVPGVDSARLTDAMRFYTELETAEAADPASAGIRHAITGTRQATGSTLLISGDTITLLDTYKGEDLAGDGTVPSVAGPRGVSLDDNTIKHITDKHGDLQRNRAVLDEVEAIVTARDLVPKAVGEQVLPRVDVPELIHHGQELPVLIELAGARDTVKITVTNEAGQLLASRTPKTTNGTVATKFTNLPPGAHTINVTGLHPGSPISPVSSDSLVWPKEALVRAGLDV